MADHKVILNLGCGAKIAPHAVNVDLSFYLRLARSPILRFLAYPLIGRTRRQRLIQFQTTLALPMTKILVHDLSKGIPFSDNSADAVYHSHLLEHLDRHIAPKFLMEIRRVLKPSGIHRICVPDLEHLIMNYQASLHRCYMDPNYNQHDDSVHALYEQSVRREAHGTTCRSLFFRKCESFIIGDARRRGETHQWMYDQCNLRILLEATGFRNIRRMEWNMSDIPGWSSMNMECTEHGKEYKPNSLYMECAK